MTDTAWTRNEIEGHLAMAHDWNTAQARGDSTTATRLALHLMEAGIDVGQLTFDGGTLVGAVGFAGETTAHYAYRMAQRESAPDQCGCGFTPEG